jgi:hypothetical protein
MWMFGISGDSIIISATAVDHDHGMFPIIAAVPDMDGRTLAPVSKIEIMGGLQTFLNFLYNSHITNVRKALHDMFVVDPQSVNLNDLLNPNPGRIIKTRQKAWGLGVKDVIQQLQVTDVTHNHMGDAASVLAMISRSKGDVSATEFTGTQQGAISRLERASQTISQQALYDMAYMFASHTQQYMTRAQTVQLIGTNLEELSAAFPNAKSKLVSPLDIMIDFDVKIGNSNIQDPQSLMALLQLADKSPTLAPRVDTMRMFLLLAKTLGIQDFESLRLSPTVMPDAQVAAQAQAGNLIPAGEV